MSQSSSVTVGTAGGTFLSLVPVIHSDEILRTIILAVIGATVSCLVSLLLRRLMKKKR